MRLATGGPSPWARRLDQLVENARIAARERVPVCQDTGTVWACLEVGPDVLVRGDVFSEVDGAVASVRAEARLRASVVRDAAFDRANTADNTPAFCEVRFVDEPGAARLHVMLKGGGSDNASRVVMLAPGAGMQGVVDEVVRCVREKGANACPPLVIGVGVGGTFDKVAGLAKRALMRPAGEPAADPRAAELEEELLAAVNATGVGPGGLGGRTTALSVRVATAPCHIAALPLAVNMGCSAMRRATIDLREAAVEGGGPGARRCPRRSASGASEGRRGSAFPCRLTASGWPSSRRAMRVCSPACCTRCATRATCASWTSLREEAGGCRTASTVRRSSTRVRRPRRPDGPSGRSAPRRRAAWTSPLRRFTGGRRGHGGQGAPRARGARGVPRDGFRLFRGVRRRGGVSGPVRGIIGDGGVR